MLEKKLYGQDDIPPFRQLNNDGLRYVFERHNGVNAALAFNWDPSLQKAPSYSQAHIQVSAPVYPSSPHGNYQVPQVLNTPPSSRTPAQYGNNPIANSQFYGQQVIAAIPAYLAPNPDAFYAARANPFLGPTGQTTPVYQNIGGGTPTRLTPSQSFAQGGSPYAFQPPSSILPEVGMAAAAAAGAYSYPDSAGGVVHGRRANKSRLSSQLMQSPSGIGAPAGDPRVHMFAGRGVESVIGPAPQGYISTSNAPEPRGMGPTPFSHYAGRITESDLHQAYAGIMRNGIPQPHMNPYAGKGTASVLAASEDGLGVGGAGQQGLRSQISILHRGRGVASSIVSTASGFTIPELEPAPKVRGGVYQTTNDIMFTGQQNKIS